MATNLKEETNLEVKQLQKVINDLKNAIQKRDFSNLKSDIPIPQKPLSWHACDSDSAVSLSFNEMMSRLLVASKDSKILVNEKPIEPLFLTVVETKGWRGEKPYLYFEFTISADHWRWLGVYDCNKRSSDFIYEQGEDLPNVPPATNRKEKTINQSDERLIGELEKAIKSKDYRILRPYVPDKKIYLWANCGPSDSGFDEFSFDEIADMLLQKSKDAQIHIDPEPEIELEKEGSSKAFIKTSGWKGDYPFVAFNFQFFKSRNSWIWVGACYSR